MAEELQKRAGQKGLRLYVQKLTHTSDKLGRIQSLQPFVKSGKLQFSRRHKTLLDQLRYFPKADHDDGPDALQMAVQESKDRRITIRFG